MTTEIACKHIERVGTRTDTLRFTKADGQVKLGGADSLQWVAFASTQTQGKWRWLSFKGTDTGLYVDAAAWEAFAPETIPGYARA